MMNWLWQGILRFGSPLLVLTVVACGGSGSRLLVVTPPTTEMPALPDQVSQANLDALVDSLPESLLLGDALEIPAQSFSFPAGLLSLTITIRDPDGEELVIVLTPELLGCNATATVCTIPATSLVLPELKPGTYSLSFEAIDQNGIPYLAEKEIAAQEQEMEDTPSPAPFNPNPGPLPDPAGTPTPSPSPGASPTPTPEATPTADPGAKPVAGFDSQPARRSTINVGSALIGQQTSTSLTIIEIGNAPLQMEASITGREASDFQIEPESFLIPDGGVNQVATITCTPSAVGSRAATLTLTTNDPARPTVSYPLICEGVTAASLLVNTLNDEDGTNPNKCSLREAIQANNDGADFGGCANPKGTITFDATLTGETITITDTLLPEIKRSVVIDGPGANSLTISGDNKFNIFNIGGASNNPVVTIQEITLTQGSTTSRGGAIKSRSSGFLIIEDVTISGSTTQSNGGAISSIIGKVILDNSILSGNSAGEAGGAISAATVYISNSNLYNNAAASDSTGSGGAIAATEVKVTDSTFDNNSAYAGGGISATTVGMQDSTLSNNTAVGSDGGGISSSGAVTLNRVTLSGNDAEIRGGGIYASTANIDNSTLSGNSAGTNGGGIYAVTTAEVSNSTLNNNTADNDGGGIRAITATVTNSTLSGNSANFGGGIRTPNQTGSGLTMTNSILSNNRAGQDGGGVNIDGVLSITQSQLIDNTADGQAGGIRAITATVTNSTLSGNSAGSNGGGIFAQTTATVSNSTLSGNNAEDRGGGIYAETSATVLNSTFYDNRSTGRGNSINFASGTFVNNLVISDSSGGTSEVAAGDTSDAVTIRHNVIRARDNTGVDVRNTTGSVTITNNRIDTNGFGVIAVNVPNLNVSNTLFSDLQATNEFLATSLAANSTTVLAGDLNTGQQRVLTHDLVADSPALDAGEQSICTAAPIGNFDQRGVTRPQPSSESCDVGAIESALPAPPP